MSLIYFGTGSFAVPALQALASQIQLVVTQPDRPSGRGLRMQPSPVKQAALDLGLEVATPEKTRAPEWAELFESLKPDALVVASYGQILSQRVLDSAKFGGINLHGSILPEYRGAAPIQRSILHGDDLTGITLMQMDKGMDTGDIIEIVTTPIGADETYGELQDRLALIAAELANAWVPRILEGKYPRTPQDSTRATIAPKIEKSEAELSIERDAKGEYARIRAFLPSPGPFIRTQVGTMRISSAKFSGMAGEAGTILELNPLTVAFRDGSIQFLEVQPEGKKRMSGRDFANGARLKLGMRLV